jgi:hypothetical protein
MARTKVAPGYKGGFGATRSGLELDRPTLDEILGAYGGASDRDPLLTPWRRGYRAAIRSALGS